MPYFNCAASDRNKQTLPSFWGLPVSPSTDFPSTSSTYKDQVMHKINPRLNLGATSHVKNTKGWCSITGSWMPFCFKKNPSQQMLQMQVIVSLSHSRARLSNFQMNLEMYNKSNSQIWKTLYLQSIVVTWSENVGVVGRGLSQGIRQMELIKAHGWIVRR